MIAFVSNKVGTKFQLLIYYSFDFKILKEKSSALLLGCAVLDKDYNLYKLYQSLSLLLLLLKVMVTIFITAAAATIAGKEVHLHHLYIVVTMFL